VAEARAAGKLENQEALDALELAHAASISWVSSFRLRGERRGLRRAQACWPTRPVERGELKLPRSAPTRALQRYSRRLSAVATCSARPGCATTALLASERSGPLRPRRRSVAAQRTLDAVERQCGKRTRCHGGRGWTARAAGSDGISQSIRRSSFRMAGHPAEPGKTNASSGRNSPGNQPQAKTGLPQSSGRPVLVIAGRSVDGQVRSAACFAGVADATTNLLVDGPLVAASSSS